MALENENKVSERQTKLVKEDEKTNSDKVMPENTISKLKEIVDFLQVKMNFNPA